MGHPSRRAFLAAAGAVVAEAVLSDAGASAATRRPRPPVTTAPPFAQRHALAALRRPVASGQLPRYVRSGPATKPFVALTMDDFFGTLGTDTLAALLDITAAKGVQMSFFPTGGALSTDIAAGKQGLWQRSVRDGHDVGNHTYSHPNLTTLSNAQITSELARARDTLVQVLGPQNPYTVRLMRPPGGAGGFQEGGDPRIMAILGSFGYSMAMWTIDSNNVGNNAPFREKIVATAKNGSIVLTHPTTLAADQFGPLIDGLRARKLEPTSITGLFSA